MRIEYHPAALEDIQTAVHYYDGVSSRLGDDFITELRLLIFKAADHPGRFHQIKHGVYRANLKRFPFHFVYRRIDGGIRVSVVRHHKRDPRFGMGRK